MSTPEIHDEQLIEQINAGGHKGLHAFNVLYKRHREFVFRLALRFTRDENDAHDVVQDTFAYLLRKFPGFTLTARLTTFLYPVVKHQSIARLKAKRKTHSGSQAAAGSESDLDPISAAPARRDDTMTDSRLSDLHSVLSNLPDLHREVIIMRFVDDLSLQEIAVALDIPVGTVKSRLHNALAALRDDPRTSQFYGLSDPEPPKGTSANHAANPHRTRSENTPTGGPAPPSTRKD